MKMATELGTTHQPRTDAIRVVPLLVKDGPERYVLSICRLNRCERIATAMNADNVNLRRPGQWPGKPEFDPALSVALRLRRRGDRGQLALGFGGRGEGDAHFERGADAEGALHPDRPAVPGDDRLADAEAETVAQHFAAT